MADRLWLGECTWSGPQLRLAYGVDDLAFSTSVWFGDVDLDALEAQIGADRFRRVVFHIAAFEANKGVNLRPARFDAGPYSDLVTPAFASLWRAVVERVWAQWRYENRITDYLSPEPSGVTSTGSSSPVSVREGDTPVLLLSGGGKDSLVSMRLLERAELRYSTLSYSTSVYGPAALQHELTSRLVARGTASVMHRQWVFEDFVDAPLGLGAVTAAETPASVFAALPIALAHGYSTVVVGHERSADTANVVWDETGEPVNHQWGKSLEAERLLQDYIERELVSGLSYTSVLKPLHDVVIFADLDRHIDAVDATHSCNVRKPWCERCAKCAYVWLGYQAYLPPGEWERMFSTNLADEPANDVHWRQMLGLAEHSPFECVGEIGEARLAFELARRNGLRGSAVKLFEEAIGSVDVAAAAAPYVTVDTDHHTMPPWLADKVVPHLAEMADRARTRLRD